MNADRTSSAAKMSVGTAAKVGRATGQTMPKRPPLSHDAEVLWDIAELYDELVCPLNGGEGVRGTGESVVMMPPTYTATVKEFERLLGVMRNQARQQAFRGESLGTLRWHILEYLLKPQRIVRLQTVKVRKGRRLVELRHPNGDLVMRPVVGFTGRDPGARKERAEDGLEWIAARWGLAYPPQKWVDPEERQRRQVAA
jgi:hypothetical protein